MTTEEQEQIAKWLAGLARADFALQLGRFRCNGTRQYSPEDYEALKPIFDAEVVARTTRRNPCHTGNPRPTLPGVHLDRKDWAIIRSLKMGQVYQAYDRKGVQWDFKRLYGSQPRYRVWTTDASGKVLAGEATLPNPHTLENCSGEHACGACSFFTPNARPIKDRCSKWGQVMRRHGAHAVLRWLTYFGQYNQCALFTPLRPTVNPLTDSEATTLLKTAGEHVDDARHHKSATGASFDYGVASGIGEAVSLAGPAWARRKLGRGEHAITRKLHNPRLSAKQAMLALQKAVEQNLEIPPQLAKYLDAGRYTFGGKPWRESIKEIRMQTALGRRVAGRSRWIGHPAINPVIREGGLFKVSRSEFDILAYTLERFLNVSPVLAPLVGEGNRVFVVTDGSRFMGIDPQGYDYPRYKTPILGSEMDVYEKAQEQGGLRCKVVNESFRYKMKNPLTRDEAGQVLDVAEEEMRMALDARPGSHWQAHMSGAASSRAGTANWMSGKRVQNWILPRYRRINGTLGAINRGLPLQNPRQAPVVIGQHCLAVEYEDVGKARREGVANPNRPWRHDFKKTGAKVFGLADGSVLIKGPHRLWRTQKNTVTGK